jgi:hypothetical protein
MDLLVNKSLMVSKRADYFLHRQVRMVNILNLENKLENKQHRQENWDNLVILANRKSVDLSVYIVEMHNAMDLSENNLENLENILSMMENSLVN